MADQVQQIKSRTDIIDVIGEYVNLKKAGRNFRGLCPFHNEKSPSFMVNPELQFYKCFGCGEAGDVFTFLQNHEKLEFYEALQILAKRAGIELETQKNPEAKNKEKIKQANFEAARFYHYILTKHPNGQNARDYLKNERKLSLETIETFKIGFAPEDATVLSKYLKSKKDIKEDIIEKSGLAYRGKYGLVDRFRGRIIFPISDHRGNVIALAGRILPELSKSGLAKYINSPETDIYHKSSSLYGIEEAKQYIKKAGNAVLTEGELDMLSSWQNGVRNVIAIKGTALTQEQVYLLSRFTDTIILALDSDFAGDNAALRGITLAQNQNLEVLVASMGKYKDPDDFVRADPDGYKKTIKSAIDVWEFLIKLADARFDLDTAVGKSKAAKFYLPFLKRLEDPVLRNHYLAEFSKKINTDPSILSKQVENVNKESSRSNREENDNRVKRNDIKKTRRVLLEETILRLAFQIDIKNIAELEDEVFSDKSLRRIIKLAQKESEFDLKEFVQKIPDESRSRMENLLLHEYEGEVDQKDFEDAYLDLKIMNAKKNLTDLAQKIQEYEAKNKSNLLKNAQKSFKKTTQVLSKLEEKRN